MSTCQKCGMPEELCMCKTIARESQEIRVYTVKRRFGKMMTVVEGIEDKDLKEVGKELKTKLACGGTAKDGNIELQGDHKRHIKNILSKMGFNEENIRVS